MGQRRGCVRSVIAGIALPFADLQMIMDRARTTAMDNDFEAEQTLILIRAIVPGFDDDEREIACRDLQLSMAIAPTGGTVGMVEQ